MVSRHQGGSPSSPMTMKCLGFFGSYFYTGERMLELLLNVRADSTILIVLLIYCCIANYLQNYWHKTAHVYYITGCVGQESEHDSAGSSATSSLTRLQSRYRQRLQGSTPSSTGAGSPSKLTRRLLARFSSLWAVGLKASAPQRMLPRGCPKFLALWSFHHYK